MLFYWVEIKEYEKEKYFYLRGINIFDNKIFIILMNLFFKYIYYIDIRCKYLIDGGLKKVICFCKIIKVDLVEEGKEIYLSSFDLVLIMYYFNLDNLKKGKIYVLVIVFEI